ncbi:MAG: MFS transporter permease [Desulfobacteraceae bacterium]|nr:MFS transporter permease [Desulfobacteraceae bacterium]
MDSKKSKQRIIPKEDAVFWMDKDGYWCNEHGKFEHPRIIKYFNASIRMDKKGYYVFQEMGEYEEKVYFPYEDTALFVLDLKLREGGILLLNNNDSIPFDPSQLFTKNDNLYVQTPDHRIKFSSRALLKISKYIKEEGGQLLFSINNKTYPI